MHWKSARKLLYFSADVPQHCRLTAAVGNMHLGSYGPTSFQLPTPMFGRGSGRKLRKLMNPLHLYLFHTCWRNLLHQMLIKYLVKGVMVQRTLAETTPRAKIPLATARNGSREPTSSTNTNAISYELPHSIAISTLKYVHMSSSYSITSYFLPVVWETWWV